MIQGYMVCDVSIRSSINCFRVGSGGSLIEWVVVIPIVHSTGDLYSVVDNSFIGSDLQLDIFADISRKLLKMKKCSF